jgi:hypothetical protein
LVPAPELLTASDLGYKRRADREVAGVEKDPRRRDRGDLREQVPEVDPEVRLQIWYQNLAVPVEQAGEF